MRRVSGDQKSNHKIFDCAEGKPCRSFALRLYRLEGTRIFSGVCCSLDSATGHVPKKSIAGRGLVRLVPIMIKNQGRRRYPDLMWNRFYFTTRGLLLPTIVTMSLALQRIAVLLEKALHFGVNV